MFRSKAIRWMLAIFGSLLLTNMIVGVIAYRKLDALDAKYSGIIDQIIPFEDEMRTINVQTTRSKVAAMLFKTKLMHGEDSPDLKALIAQSETLGDNMYKTMSSCTFLTPELKQSFWQMREKRDNWRMNLKHYLELIEQNQREEAYSHLKEELYPSLTNYLIALDDFGDHYEEAYTLMNRRMMDEASQNKKIVFGISMVPLLLLLLIPLSLALLAGVIVAVMVLKPVHKSEEDGSNFGFDDRL